jgi:hypothetical protein
VARRGPPALRFAGAPIRIVFRPQLSNCRGKLLSGEGRGQPVHAGSFLRQRRIVVDRALLARPRQLTRIVLHELFHFVWPRLGNPARLEWERMLRAELTARAPGEAGWSAEWRKDALRPLDATHRTRRWREYACESFCDTAAWLFSGALPHSEMTLKASERTSRRRWFVQLVEGRSGCLPI